MIARTTGDRSIISSIRKLSRLYNSRLVSPTALASCRAFSASSSIDSDVVIVGGGIAGCALARLLNEKAPSLSVSIVETSSGPRPFDENALPHPRSYALSPASLNILGMNNNNLQQSTLSKHRLGYYQSMQIWEANQPSSLLFRSQDLGSEHTHLGAVVEDASLQSCLWSQVQDHCQQFSDTLVSSFELPESSQSGTVTVELQNAESPLNKTTLQTRLLVAADGGNSFIRKTAGIATTDFNYQQTALTFTVELAQAHKGRAYQRFLESGPVALLPTFSEHHAIVVWSTTSEQAKQWKDHRELVSHINDLFQQGPQLLETLLDSTAGPSTAWLPLPARNILYGVEKVLETLQYGPAMGIQELQPDRFSAPPTITSISSDQFTFPLIRRTVSNYTLPRLALVGDAAHSVHPMAGQGLNLGLQDVDDLVRVITKATDAGMDVSSFLHDYESSRHQQVSLTVGGIHALQQLFHVQSVWAKHVKSMGMNVIQGVGPLRQRLVQAACLGVSSPIS